jgi:hypothetical protein
VRKHDSSWISPKGSAVMGWLVMMDGDARAFPRGIVTMVGDSCGLPGPETCRQFNLVIVGVGSGMGVVLNPGGSGWRRGSCLGLWRGDSAAE